MSALHKGTVKTVVPSSHVVSNFGPDVQSVTVAIGGKHVTVNRKGKANVKVYESTRHNRVTVTNGAGDKVTGKASDFTYLSIVSKSNVVYVQGRDW